VTAAKWGIDRGGSIEREGARRNSRRDGGRELGGTIGQREGGAVRFDRL
jgi:hypothetical protein